MSTEYLRIGLIVRPHGVKGVLKLLPLTCDNSRFAVLKDAFIEKKGQYSPVRVISARCDSDFAYVAIDGVNDITDAEHLRNLYLCVDRAHAAALPEGQYFVADIIDCDASDTNGVTLGKVFDVLETGATDVYEIHSGKRVLRVPAIKPLINSVDIAKKKIVFNADILEQVAYYEGETDEE